MHTCDLMYLTSSLNSCFTLPIKPLSKSSLVFTSLIANLQDKYAGIISPFGALINLSFVLFAFT